MFCWHEREHLSDRVHEPDALALLEQVRLEGVVTGGQDLLGIRLHPVSAITAHVLR